MIRLFVAIDPPESLRPRIAMLGRGVRDARWVAPENLHLTLRFIGEVDTFRAAEIADVLDTVRAEPFPLSFSGVGHFESRKRVRALWVGVDAGRALDELHARIESALQRIGVPPEGRRFTPHLTVARLPGQGARPEAVSGWIAANSLFRAEPFTVSRFVLYESHLRHEGSIYLPVESYPLGAGFDDRTADFGDDFGADGG